MILSDNETTLQLSWLPGALLKRYTFSEWPQALTFTMRLPTTPDAQALIPICNPAIMAKRCDVLTHP